MKRLGTISIGLFVLGAFILVLGALFLFASRDILKTKRYFVAYFEQSVNGLDIGAPIKFRGIEVGQVIAIEGVYDTETAEVTPRLILEFLPETLRNANVSDGEYTLFQPLVNRGMRASLKSQSLLTGQLYLSLDFHPDRPIRTLGNDNDPYPEMPTFDSGFDELIGAFEDLPLEALLQQTTSTLRSLEGLLGRDSVLEATDYLPILLQNTDLAAAAITALVEIDLPNTTENLRDNLTLLTEQLSGDTLKSLSDSSRQAELTFAELEKTLTLAQERMQPGDPILFELRSALREIQASAAAFKSLSEFIEQHPESFIRGKN